MEALEPKLWIVEMSNAVFGPAVRALLRHIAEYQNYPV